MKYPVYCVDGTRYVLGLISLAHMTGLRPKLAQGQGIMIMGYPCLAPGGVVKGYEIRRLNNDMTWGEWGEFVRYLENEREFVNLTVEVVIGRVKKETIELDPELDRIIDRATD